MAFRGLRAKTNEDEEVQKYSVKTQDNKDAS
jgi:hypothetical protein